MNTEQKNGGPAFPIPPAGTGDPRDGMSQGHAGMSVRDYFAGQALAGIIASERDSRASDWEPIFWASLAYRTADAMLAEREKGNQ